MTQQKKILVVAESIDVEDSSASKGRVALIKNLYKAGFELQVYHYTRKNIQLENIPCFAIKENRRSLLFFLSRLERQIRYKLKIQLNKPLEKIFGFSFTLFNDRDSIITALEKIKDFEPDLVLTLSKGGSFRPHHALLKIPKWHHKWMAYIHDPYPFSCYPRPYDWVEPGYQSKYNFVNSMSQKAAYLAFPSKLLMEWMGSYFPGCTEKGLIIPHQISEVDLTVVGFPRYFNPEKFNLLHAGNLMKQRNPKPLIEAFQIFLKNNPDAVNDARLLFFGNGSFHINYLKDKEKEIEQLYLSEGYVTYDLVLKMQYETSVNIILEAVAEVSPFLPGKFPHCVMANKPIIHLGPAKSEVRRLLGEKYDYAAEANDVKNIVKILDKLYTNWKIDPEVQKLNRPELEMYLSEIHLKKHIEKCL